MPAEPFDVFVRRIAPEHAHLILAEIERLRKAIEDHRAMDYADMPGDADSAFLLALAQLDAELYAVLGGETSPDVAPACGDACGDGG